MDYLQRNVTQELTDVQIIAIYSSKWKNFGNTMKFLRSQTGFALCIILPTGVLLGVEIFFLIRNMSQLNKEKFKKEIAEKDEQQKKQLEEERERMKQELLAEMAKQKEAKPEDDASSEAA